MTVGDQVRPVFGQRSMCVHNFLRFGELLFARCIWFDDAELQTGWFRVEMLTRVTVVLRSSHEV